MKVLRKCSPNINENHVVCFDATGLITSFDPNLVIAGISGAKMTVPLYDDNGDQIGEDHLCYLTASGYALVTLGGTFSERGGVGEVYSGKIITKSTGNAFGLVLPKEYSSDNSDYQEGDLVNFFLYPQGI